MTTLRLNKMKKPNTTVKAIGGGQKFVKDKLLDKNQLGIFHNRRTVSRHTVTFLSSDNSDLGKEEGDRRIKLKIEKKELKIFLLEVILMR